jgi:hypothetical protein
VTLRGTREPLRAVLGLRRPRRLIRSPRWARRCGRTGGRGPQSSHGRLAAAHARVNGRAPAAMANGAGAGFAAAANAGRAERFLDELALARALAATHLARKRTTGGRSEALPSLNATVLTHRRDRSQQPFLTAWLPRVPTRRGCPTPAAFGNIRQLCPPALSSKSRCTTTSSARS